MRHRPAVRVLLTAALLLLVSRARAADLGALRDTTPSERARVQTAMMQAKLGLTDEQTPKVAALNLRYAERMEPILKGAEGPLLKMRAARDVEQEKESELKELLTPAQFQKLQAAKQEMRERFADRVREERARAGK